MDRAKQDVLIFALLGQSNMDGTGSLEEFDNATDERILRVTRENKLELASEPLNEIKRKHGDSACVGPGMPFARRMADYLPGKAIALLHRGAGGTQLSQWMQGGTSYKTSLRLLLPARELGTIAGVLWHQGESDTSDRDKAESYTERFASFVKGLRQDLAIPDLPTVVGQIGPFMVGSEEHPYAGIVNQQLIAMDKHFDRVGTITSEGTTDIGDGLHLDTRSQIVMGQRYAARMMELIGYS